MTEPNDKQKEAREWEAKKIVRYCGESETPFQQKMGYVLSALSSRDTEIRDVLEGLRNPHRKVDDCWCNHDASDGSHSPACLATRALWEKVQP